MAFVRPCRNPPFRLGTHPIRTLFLLAWIALPIGSAAAATIVLDPGHGGVEKGAVSGGDFVEKQFTLSLAQRIAQHLGAGHTVELTRKADVALDPADRAAVANHLNADLMVSLHVAAAPYCGERAAAVYYHDDEHLAMPSERSIQDALAQAESGQPPWDRLQMRHQQRSLQAAEWIRQALEGSDAFDRVSVFAAPLAPLMGADLPAVLLEVGCIHKAAPPGREEIERLLAAYAESIARAIEMAIEEQIR